MNAVSEYNDVIEIDNHIGYWSHNHSGSRGKGWFVKNGEYYRSKVNNNSDVDIIEKDSSVLNSMRETRRVDYCQFGFLMELKNSGLILDKQIIRKKFQDHNCFALTFNSKDSKVLDNYFKGVNCTIFIDEQNYSLKGYTYENPKENQSYYCIVAGTVIVNDIIVPMCRIFYNSSDDSFMGINIITPLK